MSSKRRKSKPQSKKPAPPLPNRDGHETGSSRGVQPASRLRRWGFRLTAVLLIPALFFGATELGLRLAGVGYPTEFLQPSEARPGWLIDNYKFAWRFFPRALARSSQPIQVAQSKPAELKRIIVFGGSAAMGDPEPAFGFPRMLQALLELRYPEERFEVINAAMTAVNSHVVLPIAKDCRDLDADAWVIYMGNNEVVGPFGAGTVFGRRGIPLRLIRCGLALNRTKTGQLLSSLLSQSRSDVPESWGAMEMFLEHQVRDDDPALQRVYDQFQSNLEDILQLAAQDGTPVVVGTVVSNLKDCAPFASLHDPALSPDRIQQWDALYERGRVAQAGGDLNDAIAAYQEALSIDPQFAEAHFRLAECFFRVGNAVQARDHFQQARDLDTLRFRASTQINEMIRSVAPGRGDAPVYFVDASESFASQSPLGISGEEFLCEHVHFNFRGNYLLARQFAESLSVALGLPRDPPTEDWPTEQQCAERLGWTPYHRLLFAQELRSRLRTPPFNQQLNHELRDAAVEAEIERLGRSLTADTARDAIEQYQKLVDQHPEDWMLRKQFGTLYEALGDIDQATQQWVEVTRQLPHHAEAFSMVGALRNRARQWKEAEQALRTALSLRPEYARALNSLGIALSHQNRLEESYRQFEKAIQLQPNYAEAYSNWGLVLANQKQTAAAVERYRLAAKVDPDYLPAHVELGKYHVSRREYRSAEPHYLAVVRLKPSDPAAYVNLGLLYVKMNQPNAAVIQLERAVKLDPTSQLAQRALADARRTVNEGSAQEDRIPQ